MSKSQSSLTELLQQILGGKSMYCGWTTINGEYDGDNKYFPLIKENASGSIVKNGTSLPLYRIKEQLMAIRNFGKNKISQGKLSSLLEKNKELTIIGGPCLFSRSDLGITQNGIYYSLATPKDREEIPWNKKGLELKIGSSITEYHKRHIAFMTKAIGQIKYATGKELSIKIIIPCIEYTNYLADCLPDSMKKEYWNKIILSGNEIERLYKEKLSILGKVGMIKKNEWSNEKKCDISRDLKSYTASYLSEAGGKEDLIIAVEDITESPLLINVGKQTPFLIGVLGILASRPDVAKEEESHPYLI